MIEFLKEARSYVLGVALDIGKGIGWKGYLCVWPFVLAIFTIVWLIARTLLRLFL